MNRRSDVKLSVMMFLEFFIWGAWLPLIFGYLPSLGFDAVAAVVVILDAFNVAALVGDVLQHPVRRPQLRRREVPGLQPAHRRRWPCSACSGCDDPNSTRFDSSHPVLAVLRS